MILEISCTHYVIFGNYEETELTYIDYQYDPELNLYRNYKQLHHKLPLCVSIKTHVNIVTLLSVIKCQLMV